MSSFYNMIIKAISDYKVILRKTLSVSQYNEKVCALGIKRSNSNVINEVTLFKTGLKIMEDLRHYVNFCASKRSNNFYSGAEEFLLYLEQLFIDYQLDGDRVVHVRQKSSSALVTVIQLITLPKEKLTSDVVLQIKQCSDIIATYGSEEQKKIFMQVVGANQLCFENFIGKSATVQML